MKFEPAFKFNGDCAEAMFFYAGLFGGSEERAVTYGQSPEALDLPYGYEGKILHASLRVGDLRIMASDALPGRYVPGTVTTIVISTSSFEEGRRIFDSLADRGQVLFPFQKMFWSEGYGQVTDRFGVPWMVMCE